MYDELIKNLRGMAKGFCPFDIGNKMCGYFVTQEAADAIEGLSHAVDQMTEWRKNRWIPVTERLPEDRRTVLATVGGVVCAAFYGNYTWAEVETYSIFYPTHWMPIPEPPESDETKCS